jgi:hypothetical protein
MEEAETTHSTVEPVALQNPDSSDLFLDRLSVI